MREKVINALGEWILRVTSSKEMATPAEIAALPGIAKIILSYSLDSLLDNEKNLRGQSEGKRQEDVKCEYCGHVVYEKANFCTNCSSKLNAECNLCWVKKKPYSCDMAECPGYGLLVDEATKIKVGLEKEPS